MRLSKRAKEALQRARQQNSARIVAPGGVINVEVFGNQFWKPSTSSTGVTIEIGRLRARALVAA